jgi:hypothetical protein
MSSMLKPEIHWHYAGKLRTQLEDVACEPAARAVVGALGSPAQETACLFVPTTAADVFVEALSRRFKAASMKVYATILGRDEFNSPLSTVYKPEDSDYALSYYSGSATAFEEHLKTGNIFQRLVGQVIGRKFSGLVLSVRGTDKHGSRDNQPPVEECHRMAEMARQRGYGARVLPEPGLRREMALDIVGTAPSRILDGSHAWEKQLEQQVKQAAELSPIGALIQAAWLDLKSGADPGILVKEEFEARVASLGTDVARVYPWEAIISFWREILYGLESDSEYAGRWYSRINTRADGWLSLEDIHDILLYESSIYALHARVDPACVSYLVAYHGSRWLQTRMALASLFGGGSAKPGVSWD